MGDALDKLDDHDESYDFTWVGKRKSIIEAGAPINKTLRPDVENSKNWDTTESLFVDGIIALSNALIKAVSLISGSSSVWDTLMKVVEHTAGLLGDKGLFVTFRHTKLKKRFLRTILTPYTLRGNYAAYHQPTF